jgi:hypothetical protein
MQIEVEHCTSCKRAKLMQIEVERRASCKRAKLMQIEVEHCTSCKRAKLMQIEDHIHFSKELQTVWKYIEHVTIL